MPDAQPRTEAEQDALLLVIYSLSRKFADDLVRAQDVDDVTHEIALKWLIRLRTGTGDFVPDNVELFVRVLVWNHLMDRWRKRSRHQKLDASYLYERELTPPAWSRVGELDEEEIVRIQGQLIANLPYRPRLAYYLVRRQGQSYTEIARQFGVSTEAVHNYMREAHRLIRKELDAMGLVDPSATTRKKRAKRITKDDHPDPSYPAPEATSTVDI